MFEQIPEGEIKRVIRIGRLKITSITCDAVRSMYESHLKWLSSIFYVINFTMLIQLVLN